VHYDKGEIKRDFRVIGQLTEEKINNTFICIVEVKNGME